MLHCTFNHDEQRAQLEAKEEAKARAQAARAKHKELELAKVNLELEKAQAELENIHKIKKEAKDAKDAADAKIKAQVKRDTHALVISETQSCVENTFIILAIFVCMGIVVFKVCSSIF